MCVPSRGARAYENQPDGTGCSSGNACKTGEQCQTGVCTGGADVICGTDSTCATYDCNPTSGCFTINTTAGTPCAPTTCQGDQEVHTTCDGAGVCIAGAPISCDPYVCNAAGTACRTSCASDSDCQGDAYCQEGVCVDDREQGATCVRNEQCQSDSCVDGICCAEASCGPCEACNVAGSVGTCTIAVGNTCIPGDPCYTSGTCAADGTCTPTVAVECPEQECQVGVCQGGSCNYFPNDGASCGPRGDCFQQVCSSGSCQEVPANEGSSCGTGGTECNPTICRSGSCIADADAVYGQSCDDGAGVCYEDSCCLGLTTESGPCQIGYGTCCQTGSCCGGACCNHSCWFDASDGEFCCGTNSSTRCGPTCCFDGRVCHESNGVYTCAFDDQICDNNVLCWDQCCVHSGGQRTCCSYGQICSVNGCASEDRTCMSDADCISGESCVGGTYELTEDGPVRVTAGECCYGSHICPTGDRGMGDGEAYFCCGSGNYCCTEGRCADYPDYTCTGCTCSFRAVYPR